MPDPRNKILLEGVHEERATFRADGVTIVFDGSQIGGSAAVNKAVTLSGDGTVALAADGDRVVGKLRLVEFDGACSVADEGFMSLPAGNGATVTRGSAIVGALGPASAKGYVRNVNTAVAAELAKCGGWIADVSDTTKTWVKF